MRFRTEIETRPCRELQISHADHIFMAGSCFTDNVGERLERDGFSVVHNPMGPLFNPISIVNALSLEGEPPLVEDEQGTWHCLCFASRYAHADKGILEERLRQELQAWRAAFEQASVVIVTLGSAFVYEWIGPQGYNGEVVGNCHKFKAQCFRRRMISVEEARESVEKIQALCTGKKLIFTVSPIRHVADGLHGNQLSKSTLHLALHQAQAHYFPAYEIMMDDLRDYRFYAADMKHPSEVAIEYIYEKFGQTYFSAATLEEAQRQRAISARQAHIPNK